MWGKHSILVTCGGLFFWTNLSGNLPAWVNYSIYFNAKLLSSRQASCIVVAKANSFVSMACRGLPKYLRFGQCWFDSIRFVHEEPMPPLGHGQSRLPSWRGLSNQQASKIHHQNPKDQLESPENSSWRVSLQDLWQYTWVFFGTWPYVWCI